MQALPVTKLPQGDRWLYEVKLDGYRAIAIKNDDDIEIRSRNIKDLTKAYAAVCSAVKTVKAQSVVLDGEIVAVDSSGRPAVLSSTATPFRPGSPNRLLSVRPASRRRN